MKILIMMVAMVMTGGLGAGEYDTTSGVMKLEKVYFEPTQDDCNCCWREIEDQVKAYQEAKAAGDFEGARENALFHFQKAWLWNNQAYAYIQIGYLQYDQDGLERAKEWLLNAIKEAEAETLPKYKAEAAQAKAKAMNNLEFIEKHLKIFQD